MVRIVRFAVLVRDCKVVIRGHERARVGCGQALAAYSFAGSK